MNIKSKGTTSKVNFFDILIIILVVIALIFGAVLLYARARQSADTATVQYTLLVKNLVPDININLEEGQEVIDTVRLNSLGKIVSYEIVPATYNAYNKETGVSQIGVYEDRHSVSIVIEATCVNTGIAYEINGVAISVGAPIYFRTPTFTGRGYITALSVNGEPMQRPIETTEAETTTETVDTSEAVTTGETTTEILTDAVTEA